MSIYNHIQTNIQFTFIGCYIQETKNVIFLNCLTVTPFYTFRYTLTNICLYSYPDEVLKRQTLRRKLTSGRRCLSILTGNFTDRIRRCQLSTATTLKRRSGAGQPRYMRQVGVSESDWRWRTCRAEARRGGRDGP